MRQYDGRLWNFEGCGDTWGCCHGSCTHVWNYAQAFRIYFRHWKEVCVIPNFVKARMQKAIKLSGDAYQSSLLDHDFSCCC